MWVVGELATGAGVSAGAGAGVGKGVVAVGAATGTTSLPPLPPPQAFRAIETLTVQSLKDFTKYSSPSYRSSNSEWSQCVWAKSAEDEPGGLFWCSKRHFVDF